DYYCSSTDSSTNHAFF
nr:immunoglobulin light chain junction region [Macaca mulatta]MOX73523.1 immunoglobulin light chain junction region [Macaca mulatta]MOX74167.1 immunoglobulin light chain junction region [Macaca mulatta]